MKKRILNKLRTLVANPLSWWGVSTIVGSLVLFYRFPNNLFFANFYAEDGSVFVTAILQQGLFPTLFTPFNGYDVLGLYGLAAVAVGINAILFNHLLFLPHIIAIVSYIFFAACFTLPLLLFGKVMRIWSLAVCTLFALFVPLPSWDYAILGTIGNTKFLFAAIAALCVLALVSLELHNKWHRIALYAIIAVCGYTNPVVYVLVLFLLWPFTVSLAAVFKRTQTIAEWAQKLALNNRFWEVCVLGGVLGMQVLLILFGGIPEQPPYMQEPFEMVKSIEVLLARSYLFPFVLALYPYLTDSIVLCMSIVAGVCIYYFGNRKHWSQYTYLLGSIAVMTILLILTRPGVSLFFDSYTLPAGPGQFFYPQNIVAIFLFFYWLSDVSKKYRWNRFAIAAAVLICLIILAINIPHTGSFGKSGLGHSRGTFIQSTRAKCFGPNGGSPTQHVPIYPVDGWTISLPRTSLCVPILESLTPLHVSTHLKPSGDAYIAGGISKERTFTQTFVSPYNGLSGIDLYLSTFNREITPQATFRLFDASCSTELRTVELSQVTKDNQYSEILFEALPDSTGKTYCFTVTSSELEPRNAITPQFSKPNVYEKGVLTLNGTPDTRDTVFDLLYAPQWLSLFPLIDR